MCNIIVQVSNFNFRKKKKQKFEAKRIKGKHLCIYTYTHANHNMHKGGFHPYKQFSYGKVFMYICLRFVSDIIYTPLRLCILYISVFVLLYRK